MAEYAENDEDLHSDSQLWKKADQIKSHCLLFQDDDSRQLAGLARATLIKKVADPCVEYDKTCLKILLSYAMISGSDYFAPETVC